MRPTPFDYKQLYAKKFLPTVRDGRRHREINKATKEVAVGLVGHPTNVVSDVAPQRVLATIGEDLRDQEAKELANAIYHGV